MTDLHTITDHGNFKTRMYTVKEVWEAIKFDGVEHLRSEWFHVDEKGKVVGACVLGQGARNLRIFSSDADPELLKLHEGWDEDNPENSFRRYTLVEQLNQFRVPTTSKWYYSNTPVGDTIIYWNDKTEKYDKSKWELKTYIQVVEMAKDILAPYFKETVELAVIDSWNPTLYQEEDDWDKGY